jgi:hypothetical protein
MLEKTYNTIKKNTTALSGARRDVCLQVYIEKTAYGYFPPPKCETKS